MGNKQLPAGTEPDTIEAARLAYEQKCYSEAKDWFKAVAD
jgi:hypothetical protein